MYLLTGGPGRGFIYSSIGNFFLMLSYALAARRWGWYDGMPLHCRDGDDHLRELLLYAHRKRRARWTAQAVYHPLVSDPRTGEVQDTVVARHHKPEDNHAPFSYWTWSLSRDAVDGMVWVQSWQHLCCLDVVFPNGTGARIEYMTDPDGRGFYYVTAYDWIARCAEPRECVALLDAIDAPALAADYRARVDRLTLFRHLGRIRCHEDPPRRAYIERAMRGLARGECPLSYPLNHGRMI